jgi:SAM-dependent methyltransferase
MSSQSGGDTESLTSEQAQQQVNTTIWRRGGFVWQYRRRRLRPPEGALIARYHDALSGRVLELGCGGGRITGHLIEVATSVYAIDIAPDMVAYCRRTYPSATFEEGDLRDLSGFETASWDAVVAGFNVVDVLTDAERATFLDEMRRILVPGGLLIFSSHNLACAPLLLPPQRNLTRNPLRFANRLLRLPRSLSNHRRLSRQQRVEEDYAILNDEAHDYSLLHYYISRDGQGRQLARHGFDLQACLDLAGNPVGPGESAYGFHELHYAAIRADTDRHDA